MMALLQEAMKHATPGDSFVFVSDSTVPVKPFHVIQRELLSNYGRSSVCIFPRSSWAKNFEPNPKDPEQGQKYYVGLKSHQWLNLSYGHAQKIMQDYNQKGLATQGIL
jgi:hypothetical protein